MRNITTLFFTIYGTILFGQFSVNFSANPQVICVGQTISFTALTSGNVNSWAWNFGDGNTSSLQNPTHTYALPGTYTITLTASNGTVAIAEVKPNYITVNPLPNISYTTSPVGCEVPYQPVFSNVQPSGSFTYNWNFGNGQTSTNMTPTNVTYNSNGTYNVALTVTNTNTGCVNTLTQSITVTNFIADFSTDQAVYCVGETVTFTDLSSQGTNSWSWNFGTGSTSSIQNPTFTYSTPGTYNITLTAQNNTIGCSKSTTHSIEIVPLPQTSFTASPTLGCLPMEVTFTNSSTGSGSFSWDFGDGGTSTQTSPTHTYTQEDTLTVTLTQIDENGCENSVTLIDYIIASPLIVAFDADQKDGCEDLDVQFFDLSIAPNPIDDPIINWVWNFGNGNTHTGPTPPLQTYSEGIYTVSLTVSTATGCVETLTLVDSIRVGTPPIASFTYTPLSQCAKSDFEFTNTSFINVPYGPNDVEYLWEFGDGGTADVENPTYTYPIDTGYFDVQLIVSFRGCRDTVIVTDAVYIIAPISRFSPSQLVFCDPVLPLEVDFTDSSVLGTVDDDVEMIWTWGDGSPLEIFVSPYLFTNGNQGTTSHTYSQYGTYQIKQVVHNYTTGCSDSTTQFVSLSFVEANFNLSSDSVCRGQSIFFSNASSSSHGISFYQYSMGNNTFFDTPSITYNYTQSGTYQVTLDVINGLGCTSSITKEATVLQRPLAQISASPNSGCVPLDVTFTNGSSIQGNGVDLDFFTWTFEDGSTQITNSLSETVHYIFNSTGNFVTSLIATDEFGCISNPTAVNTSLTSPIAGFSADTIVCNFEDFTALNTSQDHTASEWFVNGSSVSNTSNYNEIINVSNPTNQTSLTFTLQLTVTDVNGCTSDTTQIVTISFPQANASYTFQGANVNADGSFACPPVFADLTDESVSYGDIIGWQWTFGDNNGSILTNPSNTYVFAGTYTATLIITDEFGCNDSITFLDYLEIGGPMGNVSWIDVGTLCEPEYLFQSDNLINVANISWNMGNGEIINNLDDFIYNYTTQGTYIPLVTIEDGNNCAIDYELDPITIFSNNITAFFEVDPMTLPVYQNAWITDLSTGGSNGIETWQWTFGNESFTNNFGGSFAQSWDYPGYQNIQLIVTDDLGCKDTFSLSVFITAELHIPNVLTANGDGINDFFQLKEPVFTSFDVFVFNRWGNIVHEAFNQNGVYLWDGRNKGGEMCTEGVYFFRINGIQYDGVEVREHGFVTLVIN